MVTSPSPPTSREAASSAASQKTLKAAAAATNATNTAYASKAATPHGSSDLVIQDLHGNARRLFSAASHHLVHTFGLSTLTDDEVGQRC